MVGKNFEVGDLVWAKMKGFSFWPGYVHEPPTNTKKKFQHFIFFYGTNNCAWIHDDYITHHSEEQIRKAKLKKVTSSLQSAIDRIVLESKTANKSKQTKPEKESPPQQVPSTPSTTKKEQSSKVSSTTKKEQSSKVSSSTSPSKVKSTKVSPAVSKVSKTRKLSISKESKEQKNDDLSSESSKTERNTKSAKSISLFKSTKITKESLLQKVVQSELKMKKRSVPEDTAVDKAAPRPKILKLDSSSSTVAPHSTSTPVAVIKPNVDSMSSSNQTPPSPTIKREKTSMVAAPEVDLNYLNEEIASKGIVPTSKKIGFMGLGTIGGRIARNILRTGHNVTVWSRNSEKSKKFKEIGAIVAETPSDVIEKCDLIFNCVANSMAAKMVVFGNNGVLKGFDKYDGEVIDKGYVEMTTIDPETSKEIAEAITQKGGLYLEAPISGSRELADNGLLVIIGAGERGLFHDCASVFAANAYDTYFISSAVGSGAKMNLIMSMLLGTMYAALGECMALVERLGLNRVNFLEILDMSPLGCEHLIEKGRTMLKQHFETNSSLKYQQQNMHMALCLSQKQPLVVSSNADELFKRAKLLRYVHHDVAAVYFGAKF